MSEFAGEMTPWRWDVHKFGGTSVGSADCMRKCIEIIKPLTADRRVAMVVSAMGGKPKVLCCLNLPSEIYVISFFFSSRSRTCY